MYPYLGNISENVDVIDLRFFSGSLNTYIEKHQPDTIIMVYGISLFQGLNPQTADKLFDFNNCLIIIFPLLLDFFSRIRELASLYRY